VTDINLQLTREFFELNYFRVLTPWQRAQGDADGAQLYVERPNAPDTEDELPTVLTRSAIPHIRRAIVEVRPWHSERFYASVVDASPVLYEFARSDSASAADDYFGGQPYRTILVISELPVMQKARAEAVAALERHGVQHVLEFPVILLDMLDRVTVGAEYGGSTTLQLLQLIKRYRLARNNQMEFSFPMEPHIAAGEQQIETAELPPDEEAD
jgi:hypothetical protein